jgi:hypothetical protein
MLFEKPYMHIDEERMMKRITNEFDDREWITIRFDSRKLVEKVIGYNESWSAYVFIARQVVQICVDEILLLVILTKLILEYKL